jgi:hypothetical protein
MLQLLVVEGKGIQRVGKRGAETGTCPYNVQTINMILQRY